MPINNVAVKDEKTAITPRATNRTRGVASEPISKSENTARQHPPPIWPMHLATYWSVVGQSDLLLPTRQHDQVADNHSVGHTKDVGESGRGGACQGHCPTHPEREVVKTQLSGHLERPMSKSPRHTELRCSRFRPVGNPNATARPATTPERLSSQGFSVNWPPRRSGISISDPTLKAVPQRLKPPHARGITARLKPCPSYRD